MEMSPALSNGQTDPEKTVPYGFTSQSVKGQRLGIAVGTRWDPGIKRKYKPNEDSPVRLRNGNAKQTLKRSPLDSL